MTIQPLNHDQAVALAGFVHTLRPDWDQPGIIAALGASRGRAVASELAVAAIRAAADSTNRTPAVIGMDGRHWRAGDPTPRTGAVVNGRCRQCSAFHPADVPCAPRVKADASVVAEALAEARKVLPPSKDGRTHG